MNISTVANNLRNTIAGKEALLKSIQAKSRQHGGVDAMVSGATIGFLEINIDELKRILQDVEVCVKQASDDSWITNPDRQGGQFTQDEIDNAGVWR